MRGLNKKREDLYRCEAAKAQRAGCGDNPICNLCDLPVYPGQEWDESHYPVPKALNGKRVGIAHRRHNREHGARVVTPMVAKAKRNFRKHRRISEALRPMRGGRYDSIKHKMDGDVIDRATGQSIKRPWVKQI